MRSRGSTLSSFCSCCTQARERNWRYCASCRMVLWEEEALPTQREWKDGGGLGGLAWHGTVGKRRASSPLNSSRAVVSPSFRDFGCAAAASVPSFERESIQFALSVVNILRMMSLPHAFARPLFEKVAIGSEEGPAARSASWATSVWIISKTPGSLGDIFPSSTRRRKR